MLNTFHGYSCHIQIKAWLKHLFLWWSISNCYPASIRMFWLSTFWSVCKVFTHAVLHQWSLLHQHIGKLRSLILFYYRMFVYIQWTYHWTSYYWHTGSPGCQLVFAKYLTRKLLCTTVHYKINTRINNLYTYVSQHIHWSHLHICTVWFMHKLSPCEMC
jgi:hypothetical protein